MKIEDIKVNKILDSRGECTIEVEILSEGIKEKASVPSGKSKGSYEAISLGFEEIQKNLKKFLEEVKDIDFKTSIEFDQFLIERAGKNKEKLGANFTLGASIVFVRALAKKEGWELWEYLRKEYANLCDLETNLCELRTNLDEQKANSLCKVSIPGLIINLIGGGVHSNNNLDFQEYWIIVKTTQINADMIPQINADNKNTRIDADNDVSNNLRSEYPRESASKNNISDNPCENPRSSVYENILEKILYIIKKLEEKLPKALGRNDEGAFCTNFSDNYEPFVYLREFKNDFKLGADIAANQITKLVNWKRIYEKLKLLEVEYLEDPFKEDEFEKFANLKKEGFKVIGDDLTVTNVERLKIALEKDSVDGVVVKPNQVGTIFETFEFVKLAKGNNLFTVFSHRSGETNDHWIIDLGIAFNADFFKIGPPVQGERISKYNRLLEIYGKI